MPDTCELMLLARRSRREVRVGPMLGGRERLRLGELGLCGDGVWRYAKCDGGSGCGSYRILLFKAGRVLLKWRSLVCCC